MPTYLMASGEVIDYPDPTPEVAAFLERVRTAAEDPATSPAEVLALAFGVENPVLDTTMRPGYAMVTKAVMKHSVYPLFGDLVFRKSVAASGQPIERSFANFTVSVKDAARQLGISQASVRAAVAARDLQGCVRDGEWYFLPAIIDAYRANHPAPKKRKKPVAKARVATAAKRVVKASGKRKK